MKKNEMKHAQLQETLARNQNFCFKKEKIKLKVCGLRKKEQRVHLGDVGTDYRIILKSGSLKKDEAGN